MALSGLANGSATVTATHAATGMSADVQVTAKTLQNKFYLFQLTPAAETTLQYTDGKGVPKTVILFVQTESIFSHFKSYTRCQQT